jgi:hypothetical protein
MVLGLAAACGDPDGSAQLDAASADVITADADPSCRQWRRVNVPVTEVASMELLSIHPARTARVQVTVRQCPNDLPAKSTVGFTLENEYVVLDMGVWRPGPDCNEYDRVAVDRPVAIKFPYAGSWRFTLSDSMTRSVTVDATPGGSCNLSAGSCDRDCDCAAGVCLSGMGFATAFTECARPCELDRDCGGDGYCGDVGDGLSRICLAGPECDATRACPQGFSCNAGTCEPTFQLGSTSRHACTCDAECGDGLRCAVAAGEATGYCEALCLTANDGWCQGPHVCTVGSVEPERGVCGWVGE